MCAGVTSAAFLDAANEAAFSIKCLMKSSVACPTWQAKQHQLRCILRFLYAQAQSKCKAFSKNQFRPPTRTGEACAILPMSSSACIIFFTRAARGCVDFFGIIKLFLRDCDGDKLALSSPQDANNTSNGRLLLLSPQHQRAAWHL